MYRLDYKSLLICLEEMNIPFVIRELEMGIVRVEVLGDEADLQFIFGEATFRNNIIAY